MNESKVRENVREAATFNPRKPNATRALKDDIAESQKPREKMLAGLPMTDAELLAIILGSGFQNHNVLSVAHALLKDYDNLAMLAKAGIHDLKKYDGIGEVKAIQIAAVMEIARRVKASQHDATDLSLMTHPEVVLAKVLGYKMSIDSESFFVLPLDKKCRLCGPMTEVTRGTLDSSLVHPREVFKVALKWSAASVIVAHNHPSGDPTPSGADMRMTRELVDIAKPLGIAIHDHIIVGRDGHASFRSLGLI